MILIYNFVVCSSNFDFVEMIGLNLFHGNYYLQECKMYFWIFNSKWMV